MTRDEREQIRRELGMKQKANVKRRRPRRKTDRIPVGMPKQADTDGKAERLPKRNG